MSKSTQQELMPAEAETPKPVTALAEPMDKWERLLQTALERPNAGAEQFAMLVDAITKARREEARLAFEAALGRFKSDLPQIFKNKKVTFANRDGTKTEYSHAELSEASETIADSLKTYGLSHSWRPSEGESGRTLMTCVFRHPESGHVQDMATLGGPPDNSGGKNSVQAIGSTVSYLERYTLLAAAGIVAKGMDDDGRSAEGMSENAITDYCVQMQDARVIGPQEEKGSLQFIFAECFEKAKKAGDRSARDRFVKVYNERKKVLWGAGR